jgi:hypothetical protein
MYEYFRGFYLVALGRGPKTVEGETPSGPRDVARPYRVG